MPVCVAGDSGPLVVLISNRVYVMTVQSTGLWVVRILNVGTVTNMGDFLDLTYAVLRRRVAAFVVGGVPIGVRHSVNIPIRIVTELRGLTLEISIMVKHLLGRQAVVHVAIHVKTWVEFLRVWTLGINLELCVSEGAGLIVTTRLSKLVRHPAPRSRRQRVRLDPGNQRSTCVVLSLLLNRPVLAAIVVLIENLTHRTAIPLVIGLLE